MVVGSGAVIVCSPHVVRRNTDRTNKLTELTQGTKGKRTFKVWSKMLRGKEWSGVHLDRKPFSQIAKHVEPLLKRNGAFPSKTVHE